MKDNYPEISAGSAAIIAAVSLILMTILAPIANFGILNELIVVDNAAKTFSNIVASEASFRLTICFFLIVAILDVVIAWALYIFLKPVNKYLSLLTAWLRLVYAVALVVALFFLIHPLLLLSGPDYLNAFDTHQIQTQVMLSVQSFSQFWEFSLIIFGFHLLLLGYLMLTAGYMRKVLGILLFVASSGYLIDGFGKILTSSYDMNVAAYTFIGEVILIFWLFIQGIKN